MVLLFDLWHPELTAAEIGRVSRVFSPVWPCVRADAVLLSAAAGSIAAGPAGVAQPAHTAEDSRPTSDLVMAQELQSVLREVDRLKRELGLPPAGQADEQD